MDDTYHRPPNCDNNAMCATSSWKDWSWITGRADVYLTYYGSGYLGYEGSGDGSVNVFLRDGSVDNIPNSRGAEAAFAYLYDRSMAGASNAVLLASNTNDLWISATVGGSGGRQSDPPWVAGAATQQFNLWTNMISPGPPVPTFGAGGSIQFSISDGIVTWSDKNGWSVAQYRATSGPFGKGPLPIGRYLASNFRARIADGMVCGRGTPGQIGFSVDLTPRFSTDRDLLRIHPREGDGTLGCIGIVCEDAQRFRNALSGYFGAGGQTTIVVWVLP